MFKKVLPWGCLLFISFSTAWISVEYPFQVIQRLISKQQPGNQLSLTRNDFLDSSQYAARVQKFLMYGKLFDPYFFEHRNRINLDGLIPITLLAWVGRAFHYFDIDKLLIGFAFIMIILLLLSFGILGWRLADSKRAWSTLLAIPLLCLALYRPLVIALSVPSLLDAFHFMRIGFLMADNGATFPNYSAIRFYTPSLEIAWLALSLAAIYWADFKARNLSYVMSISFLTVLIASLIHIYGWASLLVSLSVYFMTRGYLLLHIKSKTHIKIIAETILLFLMITMASLPMFFNILQTIPYREASFRNGSIPSHIPFVTHQILFVILLLLCKIGKRKLSLEHLLIPFSIAVTGIINVNMYFLVGFDLQNYHFVGILGPIALICIFSLLGDLLPPKNAKRYSALLMLSIPIVLGNTVRWGYLHAQKNWGYYSIANVEIELQKELSNERYLGKVILPGSVSLANWVVAISPAFSFIGEGVSSVSSPEISNGELVARCWISAQWLYASESSQIIWAQQCVKFTLHYYLLPESNIYGAIRYPTEIARQEQTQNVLEEATTYLINYKEHGCSQFDLNYVLIDRIQEDGGSVWVLTNLNANARINWQNSRFIIKEIFDKSSFCSTLNVLLSKNVFDVGK